MRVNLDEVEARLRVRGPTAVVAADEGLVIYCEYGDGSLFSELARRSHGTCGPTRGPSVPSTGGLPLNANGKADYQRLGQA